MIFKQFLVIHKTSEMILDEVSDKPKETTVDMEKKAESSKGDEMQKGTEGSDKPKETIVDMEKKAESSKGDETKDMLKETEGSDQTKETIVDMEKKAESSKGDETKDTQKESQRSLNCLKLWTLTLLLKSPLNLWI